MPWDSVPWLIGNGAEHSAEVARMIPYIGLSGNEGVAGARDMTVRALAAPSGAVTVDIGACSIRNRATGGSYQSYLGRVTSLDQVTVPPNLTTSTRYDLVIARVEDPNMPGTTYAQPADIKRGPYIFTRVITGVPAGTTRVQNVSGRSGESAITLARLAVPANTSAIGQSMITDLRKVAQPRRESRLFTTAVVTADTDHLGTTFAPTADAELWPNPAAQNVEIPEWATSVKVVATWSQVFSNGINATGMLWVRIGPTAGPYVETQRVGYNIANASDGSRHTFICASDVNIPASMRGTTQQFGLRGGRLSGTGTVTIDGGSSTVLQLEFVELPDPT